MPRTISGSLLPYFYRRNQTVLHGYEIDIDGDDTFSMKYVANNEDVGAYTALAVKRGTITSEDGTILNELEVGLDNIDLEFQNEILGGLFERKQIKINLLFVSSTGTLQGSVLLMLGILDAPKGDENWVTMTVRPLQMLDREFPRRIYQSGCNNRFCDDTCSLNITDFDYDGALTAESNGTLLTISHGQIESYFYPGYARITSGAYAGEVRPIASNTTTTVTLRVPFGHTIPNGTTMHLQKLCPKTPSACINTFSNYDNYTGFPHTPKQPIV